jgi:hypothetical protein
VGTTTNNGQITIVIVLYLMFKKMMFDLRKGIQSTVRVVDPHTVSTQRAIL